MGNSQNKFKDMSLSQRIDSIATGYILTTNFQDYKNLAKDDYCNKIVIITSKILDKNLSYVEAEVMNNRLKYGVDIHKLDLLQNGNNIKVDFLNKGNLDSLDEQNPVIKKSMCESIAKYYVLIAHLFSAIVTIVRPDNTQNGLGTSISNIGTSTSNIGTSQGLGTSTSNIGPSQGLGSSQGLGVGPNNKDMNTYSEELRKKYNLLGGVDTKQLPITFCNRRINALGYKSNIPSMESIKLDVCSMNESNKSNSISDETGFSELNKLYNDDYDPSVGEFTKRTEKMQGKYIKDLKTFYKHFTGKSFDEDYIKDFSDIPLRDYKYCSKEGGVYNITYNKDNDSSDLFKEYADHLNNMLKSTKDKQDKLNYILEDIFVYKDEQVIINPELTEAKLDEYIEEVRNIIVDLYISCDNDFLKGLEIFEKIANEQIIKTNKSRKENVEVQIESLLA
jgi:hypothetical protein